MENCHTRIEYQIPSLNEFVKQEDIYELSPSEGERSFDNGETELSPVAAITLPLSVKEEENVEDGVDDVQIIRTWPTSQVGAEPSNEYTPRVCIGLERSHSLQNFSILLSNPLSCGRFSEPLMISAVVPGVAERDQSNVTRHWCRYCPQNFLREYDLNVHLESHSRGKHLRCSICEARFSHADALRTHLCTHEDMRPFKCLLCGRSFLKSHDLRVHGTQAHTPFKRRYTCEICTTTTKTFSYMSNLMVHTRKEHPGELPRTCRKCGKLCADDGDSLECHVRTHAAAAAATRSRERIRGRTVEEREAEGRQLVKRRERPFRCHVCGLDFVHIRYLQNHIKYHGRTEKQKEENEF